MLACAMLHSALMKVMRLPGVVADIESRRRTGDLQGAQGSVKHQHRCGDERRVETTVVTETVGLATRTLPLLSRGWGGGASMVCVTCWSLSLSTVAKALENIATGTTLLPPRLLSPRAPHVLQLT
jgi:hypothetical protein